MTEEENKINAAQRQSMLDNLSFEDAERMALRTEPNREQYQTAVRRLVEESGLLPLMATWEHAMYITQLGRCVDMQKKHIFYGKPVDPQRYGEQVLTRDADGPAAAQRLKDNPHLIRLLHALMGCMTEVGELYEQVMAHLFYGDKLDLVNLDEESGDALWHLRLMPSILASIAVDRMDRSDVGRRYDYRNMHRRNVEKLLKRFPDKFTEKNAVDRDLAGERETLEK